MARATAAAKAEASEAETPDERSFEFEGKTYVLPEDLDEVALFEAYEDGRIISAARVLVGMETWKEFREKTRTMEALNEMLNAAFAAMDTSSGESSAS